MMGYDERTAERVRRILSRRGDSVEKRMMGGLVFMVRGRMCCGVSGTALMVRVGAGAHERVLTRPHARPMTIGDRTLTGFVYVDPEGYRTEAALAIWIERGIDVALTLPPKKSADRLPERRGEPKASARRRTPNARARVQRRSGR